MVVILALLAAAAPAADKKEATCLATRFTLDKPVAAKPQAEPGPKKTVVAQAAPPAPKPRPRPKPEDCPPKKAS